MVLNGFLRQEITLAANDERQFSLYFSFTVHRGIFQKFKYYNACQVIPESLFLTVFIRSFPSLRLYQRESHRVAMNVIPILPYVLQEEPDS